MNKLENKILKAIENNKLNLNKLGERSWYNYFIQINELVWARNFWDGYNVFVYSDKYKTEHLASFTVGYDHYSKPFLRTDYL